MRLPFACPGGGAVTLTLVIVFTGAVAQAQVISDGPQIELRDMAARVVVTPEARTDIDIKVRYGKVKVPTLMVSRRGEVTVLNGHLSRSGQRLRWDDDRGHVFIPGAGRVKVEDLPLVFVRVPNHAVVKNSAHTIGHIKTSRSLDIIMNGTGRWTVEPVAGPLNIINSGPGDIRLTSAADAIIDNMGPGEISINSVRNLKVTLTGPGGFTATTVHDVDISNQGPGDIHIGTAHRVRAKINGPGDLKLGQVMNGMTLINNGPADVSVNRIGGPVSLHLAGSGDVNIASGNVTGFVLRGSGSGDVAFGGTAGTVNIDSNGPGDISITKVVGPVITKVNGSGQMNIGQ